MPHGQRRDGLYSISKTAKQLCRFIVDFAPVIQRLYPANSELQNALAAALAACQALDILVTAQKEEGV